MSKSHVVFKVYMSFKKILYMS